MRCRGAGSGEVSVCIAIRSRIATGKERRIRRIGRRNSRLQPDFRCCEAIAHVVEVIDRGPRRSECFGPAWSEHAVCSNAAGSLGRIVAAGGHRVIGEVFRWSDTTDTVTSIFNSDVLRTARSRDVTPRNNKLQTSCIRSGYLRQLNRLIGSEVIRHKRTGRNVRTGGVEGEDIDVSRDLRPTDKARSMVQINREGAGRRSESINRDAVASPGRGREKANHFVDRRILMVNDGPARTDNRNNRIEVTAARSVDIAFIKFASGQRRNVRERDRGSGVVAGVRV